VIEKFWEEGKERGINIIEWPQAVCYLGHRHPWTCGPAGFGKNGEHHIMWWNIVGTPGLERIECALFLEAPTPPGVIASRGKF
jgi:hypothetical protein